MTYDPSPKPTCLEKSSYALVGFYCLHNAILPPACVRLTSAILVLNVVFIDDDGNNTWPEVLKFLFDCTNTGTENLKESALIIFRFGFSFFAELDCIKKGG